MKISRRAGGKRILIGALNPGDTFVVRSQYHIVTDANPNDPRTFTTNLRSGAHGYFGTDQRVMQVQAKVVLL